MENLQYPGLSVPRILWGMLDFLLPTVTRALPYRQTCGNEFPDVTLLYRCRDRQVTWLYKYHYIDCTIVHIVVQLGASI